VQLPADDQPAMLNAFETGCCIAATLPGCGPLAANKC
jgi:hypothetical protein